MQKFIGSELRLSQRIGEIIIICDEYFVNYNFFIPLHLMSKRSSRTSGGHRELD